MQQLHFLYQHNMHSSGLDAAVEKSEYVISVSKFIIRMILKIFLCTILISLLKTIMGGENRKNKGGKRVSE